MTVLLSLTLIQQGTVPLEIAAENGQTETVQTLLEAGANVNYQNKVMTVNVVFPCKYVHFRKPMTPLCKKVALCLIARPSHNSGRSRDLKREVPLSQHPLVLHVWYMIYVCGYI